MDNNHSIALKWLQSTIRSQQKQVVKTADTKETAALAENKPWWLCSEGSCEGEDADGKRHRQMRPTGWGSAQDHCCWHGSPVLDARARTGLAPQKRGAAAVWNSGLQRHPKLGLGAVAASASPRGRWKKTQCRRAGELEDQSRNTEISLATQGTNGTNSSTATRWIQAGLLQKLSKIYFGRVRYRQTAPEGLLWKHKAPPWIEIVLYK